MEALYQVNKLKNREYRFPVYLKIIGLFKILFDNPMNNHFIIMLVHHSGPYQRIGFITMRIPEITIYIVVGPHQIKLHLIVIGSSQKAFVNGVFQIGLSIEPIPIIDKYIYSVIDCGIYFLLYRFRITVTLISPQRNFRLIMVIEPAGSLFYNLPFSLTLAPKHIAAHRFVMTRRPNVSGDIIFISHIRFR